MDILLKIILAIAFCLGIQFGFTNIGNIYAHNKVTFWNILIMSVCWAVIIMFKILHIW